MASENIDDWDLPLPTSEEKSEESDDGLAFEERRHNEHLKKLKSYVEFMAYRPVKPIKASPHIESLAKPRKTILLDNAKQFADDMVPAERGERLKRLAIKHETITMEKLEEEMHSKKVKRRQKKNILKRKQELYCEMLTKLELQCRTQYLSAVFKKFANFIAKLSTTMRIPSIFSEPYARMQRGILCNIYQSIGVQPTTQAGICYNSNECEYQVCYKLSHALLSLIIKALDIAATRNTNDEQPLENDFKMDNYIKERLMYAAERKIMSKKRDKIKTLFAETLDKKLEKCINKF